MVELSADCSVGYSAVQKVEQMADLMVVNWAVKKAVRSVDKLVAR